MESPKYYKFVYMIPGFFLIHKMFLFEYIDIFKSHALCYTTGFY